MIPSSPRKRGPRLDSRLRGNERKRLPVSMLVPAIRFFTSLLAALIFASVIAGAKADDYPSRPIKLIVAFTPGGTTDITARLIADKTQRILGQPIAVENKPGASGAIAAQYVAQADADGYTLFFSTVGAIAINPAFRGDLGYDALKD